jgi:single-strand DNA-binding protein
MNGIAAACFGMLGADAEAKTSAGGRQYLRCRVRVGEGDAGQWVSVMVFDEEMIGSAEKLTKGSRIYLEGTIRLDEWDGRDGQRKHGLTIMANHIRVAQIGRNRVKDEGRDRPRMAAAERQDAVRRSSPVASDPDDDDIPF